MISLKNNNIAKLLERLYDIVSNNASLSPIQIVCYLSGLLLLKRDKEIWKDLKRNQYHASEISQKLNHHFYILNYNQYRPSCIPEQVNKINFHEIAPIIYDCVEIIDTVYGEVYDRSDKAVDSISAPDIDGLIFDELLEKSVKQSRYYIGENMVLPSRVCKLMANLLEIHNPGKIYDPMCGSGSLLLSAYEQILFNKYSKELPTDTDVDGFATLRYKPKNASVENFQLTGLDSDKDLLLLSCCNLELRGIENVDILREDYIESYKAESADYIIANPPFGQKLDREYYASKFSTRSKELAFIHKIYTSLNYEGKASIIVSDGFLSNGNTHYIQFRKLLLENSCLEAVVSLPSGIFRNTKAKTSIIILSKNNDCTTEKIWFYEIVNDGYTKVGRRTKETPLPDTVRAFQNRYTDVNNGRTEQSFYVPLEEISKNDYNLTYNRYKKNTYNRQEYENYNQILMQINDYEAEIQKELEDLNFLIDGIEI